MKPGFTVVVQNKDREDRRYDIPENVYYYIKQLEAYVRDLKSSSIKARYKDRFPETAS